MNSPLTIEGLLVRFEQAEIASRQHPSAPPRPPEGVKDERSEAWQASWQKTHQALVDAQGAVAEHAKVLMRVLRAMSSNQYNVDLAIRELTYFNTWMSLRADKRWGSEINAQSLASSMGSHLKKPRVLSGDKVEVLYAGDWLEAVVSESCEEIYGDFWFKVVLFSTRLLSADEGVLWRRK